MPAPKLTETHNVLLIRAGWSPYSDRFYPCNALSNLVNQFEPGIGDFIFPGDRPGLRMDLAAASHRTNRLYLKNNGTELWAEIQLIDTDCGRLVRDLLKTKGVFFDVQLLGVVNKYSEVQPDTVEYLRVSAIGGTKR